MIPFNIDIGRISFPTTIEVLAPFLPGGVLVTGILFGRPDLLSKLTGLTALGYFTKLGLAVFVAFSSGFVLFFLSFLLSVLIAMPLLFWSQRGISTNNYIFSDVAWRKAAAEFLGKLSPSTQETEQSKTEWLSWHNALEEYLDKEERKEEWVTMLYTGLLHSVGWAVGIILILSPDFRHPLIYLLASVTIVAGLVCQTTGAFLTYSPGRFTRPQFTALLLAKVRARENRTQDE
ncbi:MAG: hypothetical protein A3J28_18990 [Acidobacteria bacterium RIFCSPLOWO2_12_FULL_60_22]|nr:MAG: hypothetical protein A3J28_18990 [Acidobacteria bacterium RIFCSPLOWO2_12_FULL_60_22]